MLASRPLTPLPPALVPQVRPKLEKDPRWALLPSNKERRAVFEEFCKSAGAEQKAAKEAAAKAAVEGFKALLEEALGLERRVAAELEAAAGATEEEQQQAAGSGKGGAAAGVEVEEGEVGAPGSSSGGGRAAGAGGGHGGGSGSGDDMDLEGEGGGGGSGPSGTTMPGIGGNGAAAHSGGIAAGGVSGPRPPEAIAEDELEGLGYEQLERYWREDERWGALDEAARRALVDARFGAALAAGAARREVSACAHCWWRWPGRVPAAALFARKNGKAGWTSSP